jgi:hypothetical protein
MIIQVETLNSNYAAIDCQDKKRIQLEGHYVGNRIKLTNARNCIVEQNAYIESWHPEDAIVIEGAAENFAITGTGAGKIAGGGITFWDKLTNVTVEKQRINYAHHGIRATQDHPHSQANIRYNEFTGIWHECVYIGPSRHNEKTRGRGVYIHNNKAKCIGWDPWQVGNSDHAEIYDNITEDAATLDHRYQDYVYTFNNSVVFMWGNKHQDRDKLFQSLGGKLFPHKPSK